jgi:hypothetical protein
MENSSQTSTKTSTELVDGTEKENEYFSRYRE